MQSFCQTWENSAHYFFLFLVLNVRWWLQLVPPSALAPLYLLCIFPVFPDFNRAMPHNLLIQDNVWYISWLAIFSSKVFTCLASVLWGFKMKQHDCAFLLGPSIQRQGTADSGQPLLCSDCLCQCNETPDSIPSSSCEKNSSTHSHYPLVECLSHILCWFLSQFWPGPMPGQPGHSQE